MNANRKISTWLIFEHMSQTDDNALKLAPIDNILEARLVKHGTKVTIGVGEDITGKILKGELIGGFIFCDKEHFEEVRTKLQNESSGPDDRKGE
jgi:hypothetical protein